MSLNLTFYQNFTVPSAYLSDYKDSEFRAYQTWANMTMHINLGVKIEEY